MASSAFDKGCGLPGMIGMPSEPRQLSRLGLIAKQRQRFRTRSDEGDALFEASLCETGILGQEAVAGMHAIAATCLRGLDQCIDIEIGANRIARRSLRAASARDSVLTRVWSERASAGAYTLTDSTSSAAAARATRMAISPRLAIKTRLNKGRPPTQTQRSDSDSATDSSMRQVIEYPRNSHGCKASQPVKERQTNAPGTRYTCEAVPLKSADFSSAEAPAARRLQAFHKTA